MDRMAIHGAISCLDRLYLQWELQKNSFQIEKGEF